MLAQSPEIGQESVWLDVDRTRLSRYLEELPERVRYRDRRLHLISTRVIELRVDRASACSSVAVCRTSPGGATALDAVGQYQDTFRRQAGEWRISHRRVQLDTRVDTGNHVPF